MTDKYWLERYEKLEKKHSRMVRTLGWIALSPFIALFAALVFLILLGVFS